MAKKAKVSETGEPTPAASEDKQRRRVASLRHFVQKLDAGAIRDRLDEIEKEAASLRVLLAAAEAQEKAAAPAVPPAPPAEPAAG